MDPAPTISPMLEKHGIDLPHPHPFQAASISDLLNRTAPPILKYGISPASASSIYCVSLLAYGFSVKIDGAATVGGLLSVKFLIGRVNGTNPASTENWLTKALR